MCVHVCVDVCVCVCVDVCVCLCAGKEVYLSSHTCMHQWVFCGQHGTLFLVRVICLHLVHIHVYVYNHLPITTMSESIHQSDNLLIQLYLYSD